MQDNQKYKERESFGKNAVNIINIMDKGTT